MTTKGELDMTAAELKAKYDALTLGNGWSEHPAYSFAEWREDVANENTLQGYWEWVWIQLGETIVGLPKDKEDDA